MEKAEQQNQLSNFNKEMETIRMKWNARNENSKRGKEYTVKEIKTDSLEDTT